MACPRTNSRFAQGSAHISTFASSATLGEESVGYHRGAGGHKLEVVSCCRRDGSSLHQSAAGSRDGKARCGGLRIDRSLPTRGSAPAATGSGRVTLGVKDLPVLILEMTAARGRIPIGSQTVNDHLQMSFDSKKDKALVLEKCSKFRRKAPSFPRGGHRRPPPLT